MAARIAQQTLLKRNADYVDEVRRILDAALEVMCRCGVDSRPRVADIVAEAGLSNDAFYRHFPSKDALVLALLDDGAERLGGYLVHQMDKETTAAGRLRRWVAGVLSQAEPKVAATTLAVLHNSGGVGQGTSGRHFASDHLSRLIVGTLADLGSPHPELDAALLAHAVLGRLTDHLWSGTRASSAEIDHITELWTPTVGTPST